MRLECISTGDVYNARLFDKWTFSDHGAFRKLLEDITAAKIKQCVLDLSALDLIDSSGLGMIMIAIEEAKRSGWSLTVKDAKGPVRQLLQLSKLDRLLIVA